MDYKIEKLSDFIGTEGFLDLANQIYFVTDHLRKDYPNHQEWFFNKHLPEVGKNREVFFVRIYNNVYGVAFVKNTKEEKKICTFYIMEHARNIGIGRALMKTAMQYLQTTKPMITMPGHKVRYFLHFMHMYDWKICQIIDGAYIKDQDEIVFNGVLKQLDIDKKTT